jgi:hypothetical protein
MPFNSDGLPRNTVELRDDSNGVSLERQTRTVQERHDENGYFVSLKLDWLNQLDLDEQGQPTLHSLSTGMNPVVIHHPAIIIQPADAIPEDYK